MKEWFNLTQDRQKTIIAQVSAKTGLPSFAVEKDFWVTQCLNASFNLEVSSNLIFKGGTSLSKAWSIIERFSEDIDLCINRKVLGFEGELSKTQISRLRKASCKYTSTELPKLLETELLKNGLKTFKIEVRETNDSDKDPQVIEIHYNSITEPIPYMLPKVIVEVGARSLIEPTESREIQSLIGIQYPEQKFSGIPFSIPTVLPKRTFLEKIFLLHEEFQKRDEYIRTERMTRHHYDLEKLMDTEHGMEALLDEDLYSIIVKHRSKFNLLRGLNYSNHSPEKVSILPPKGKLKEWKNDYEIMRESMIYGESLNFEGLIDRITELEVRLKSCKYRL
ncbi:nucleotidyl transferase AbiEii/AbiGii toxin family protein [Algibacter sp. 2305UL17-15]|uniref:nucleotidyl transferase AbiEii/AbiGii toxin family protein n=1 Tax=Algibacter sp. 2305UL17-15 TaxID=3231268 RepID=UPI0034597696